MGQARGLHCAAEARQVAAMVSDVSTCATLNVGRSFEQLIHNLRIIVRVLSEKDTPACSRACAPPTKASNSSWSNTMRPNEESSCSPGARWSNAASARSGASVARLAITSDCRKYSPAGTGSRSRHTSRDLMASIQNAGGHSPTLDKRGRCDRRTQHLAPTAANPRRSNTSVASRWLGRQCSLIWLVELDDQMLRSHRVDPNTMKHSKRI